MNIRLRQLRAFVELAQTQSFTLAAQNLFISQSALSSLIKQMESNLGLQLFDRSTRYVKLSTVGEDLYPHIQQILVDLESVLEAAANLKALKKGIVRVAAPQLLASTMLVPIIASFRELHPAIHVQLMDCGVEQVELKVLAGEVDLGIGPERDWHADLQSELLFERAFCAVIPPEHALAHRPYLSWQELDHYPLILLQGQFTKQLFGDLSGTDYSPEFHLRPNSQVQFMSTALSMVHSGLGLSLCLPYARPLVDAYGLKMIDLQPAVRRKFYTYQRQARALSPAAEQFKQHLQQCI